MARVFLDSGVFVKAICADWGAAKAILVLGCYSVLVVETSEVVLAEVVAALQRKDIPTGPTSDFAKLLKKLRLTLHPKPSRADVQAGIEKYLPLMRHKTDVAVLVSAILANPDWLVSDNPDHFSSAVASASGLRIVSSPQLMRYLNVSHEKKGGT
ncbi:MAG: hypothetical protein EPO21_03430 [Chloroflexota bacterium]|nr:MAG: hypothetical protein EPO21_03430 [Chloroflexota bacterium]